MRKRKGLLFLSLFVGVAVALAACGGAVSPASTSTPESTPEPSPALFSPTAAPPQPTAPSSTATVVTPRPTAPPSPTSDPTAAPEPLPSPTPAAPEATTSAKITSDEPGEVGSLAPELSGIEGWLNSEPFTLAGLRGQVVLVDFWTYTCVNCIRTFPFLKEWYEKYGDLGLEIVGVHSPEFEFETVRENVAEAIERHGIQWPVAQDNGFLTWRSFNNRFWPAKYLLDADGVIRYRHFGEGSYDETEAKIRELLEEIGVDVSGIIAGTDAGPSANPAARASTSTGQTRELYAGIERNASSSVPYLGNNDYYYVPPNTPNFYRDPGKHNNHFLYLEGAWTNGFENLRHARVTQGLEDYVALKFFGTSVNVVIDFEGSDPFDVVITVDDKPVLEAERGDDLSVNGEGMTVVTVDEPRMYNLLQLPEYGGRELKLSSNSDRFGIFAFTFGSYGTGP